MNIFLPISFITDMFFGCLKERLFCVPTTCVLVEKWEHYLLYTHSYAGAFDKWVSFWIICFIFFWNQIILFYSVFVSFQSIIRCTTLLGPRRRKRSCHRMRESYTSTHSSLSNIAQTKSGNILCCKSVFNRFSLPYLA